MNAKDLKYFKKTLEAERDRITSGQLANDETLHIDANEQADDVDAASTGAEQSFRMRLRSRDNLYLKKVLEALEKITQGEFGVCEDCEEDIDVRRLKARPTAALCISCKEEQEKSEKSTADGIQHKSVGKLWQDGN
jgi:DnaK suppressor protein